MLILDRGLNHSDIMREAREKGWRILRARILHPSDKPPFTRLWLLAA